MWHGQSPEQGTDSLRTQSWETSVAPSLCVYQINTPYFLAADGTCEAAHGVACDMLAVRATSPFTVLTTTSTAGKELAVACMVTTLRCIVEVCLTSRGQNEAGRRRGFLGD